MGTARVAFARNVALTKKNLELSRRQAMSNQRPSLEQAEQAITEFLSRVLDHCPHFLLCEDGETSWAFWVLDDDDTSYLNHELKFQWYGTSWEPDADKEEASDEQ